MGFAWTERRTGNRATVDEKQAAELTHALLEASRALVAVAARSLDDLDDDLTLPQFRALVVLHTAGPLSTTALAEQVGVHQSTATRLTARLDRQQLVTRTKDQQDRRLTIVELAPSGQALVERVMDRRTQDIATVVRSMGPATAGEAVAALRAFGDTVRELAADPAGERVTPGF